MLAAPVMESTAIHSLDMDSMSICRSSISATAARARPDQTAACLMNTGPIHAHTNARAAAVTIWPHRPGSRISTSPSLKAKPVSQARPAATIAATMMLLGVTPFISIPSFSHSDDRRCGVRPEVTIQENPRKSIILKPPATLPQAR